MGSPGRMYSADLMASLEAEPQEFDFVQAMELLEALDADGLRFGAGLERRVKLRPCEDLVFPASDIRRSERQGSALTLLMGFFGLYGVDAPVPHYLLDRTTAEDEDAARMRQFLDLFNHRFYVLLYRAMQISRPAAGQLPLAFRGCAGAVAGQIDQQNGKRRYPAARVRTRAGLAGLIKDHFPEVGVEVIDCQPVWRQLGEGCVLGSEQSRLGDNSILGGKAFVADGSIQVRLGPLAAAEAQHFLPGQQQGQALQQCINDYLSDQAGSELQIRVKPSHNQGAALGSQEARLGWSLWLGERLQDEYLIRVSESSSAKLAPQPDYQ